MQSHQVAIIHNHPIHYKELLFRALQKQGLDFEVIFVADRSIARLEPIKLDPSAYHSEVSYRGPFEGHPLWSSARFTWKALNRIDPALVIMGGYHHVAGWTAWLWASLHRRKKILWIESNSFDYTRHWWRELPKKLFVRHCELAHVYGTSNRAYMNELGMPLDRIIIKRAVVNVQSFRINKQPRAVDKTLNLLFVGRLAPEKNLAFLLRALSKYLSRAKNPISLTIVGYGPEETSLKQLVLELGIDGDVRFHGPAAQADLPGLYAKADAFILPSIREPWGLVALEAMLAEIPVAVSTQCGCAEDLVTPETGWIFSPDNIEVCADVLDRIASTDEITLRRMGRAAAILAKDYTPENCARIICMTVKKLTSILPDDSDLVTSHGS